MAGTSYDRLIGKPVLDRNHQKIGTIEQLYVDRETRRPEWLAVSTGWFGTNLSFVPIVERDIVGEEITVGYDKDAVANAPRVEPDGGLSEEQEEQLYSHYGFDYSARAEAFSQARRPELEESDETTRSEEHLRAGTLGEGSGRVRLRKYVVTEEQQVTVPVQREEVRVEREPIRGAEAGDTDITEREQVTEPVLGERLETEHDLEEEP